MNNKRSPGEQFILIALLTLSAYMLSQHFFGNKNTTQQVTRATPTLAKAFAGLNVPDVSNGVPSPPVSEKAALAQTATLEKEVAANPKDEYSVWANLRLGLLQQYVLKNSTAAIEAYDKVINRQKNEAPDAQAIYQKGDLLWRQAQGAAPLPAPTATPTATSGSGGAPSTPANAQAPSEATRRKTMQADGAQTLEQILIRSRGHRAFLDTKIFVPGLASATGDPLRLPAKWEELPLTALIGNTQTSLATEPRAILTRVDAYYATTWLYKVFDFVVHLFGANPAFSYGLALVFLALATRFLMQPLIRKQYQSMKAMQLIAPEMKKIQEKYKGKSEQESQMRMMSEIRALQKDHGVNPMGCGISLLIQMPIFFLFVLPLINHYQARMELAGASFGWIHSLARPDIPLLVLYAISMFVSVRLSSTPPADDQQAQMQKMTTFMSPLFALVLWSYPSAFILYWMTYNVLSTAMQWRMMKAGDPEKNVVKTLIGTGFSPAPAAALSDTKSSVAGSPSSRNGAIPPRPGKSTRSAARPQPTLQSDDALEKDNAFNNETALETLDTATPSPARSDVSARRRNANARGNTSRGNASRGNAARRRRR